MSKKLPSTSHAANASFTDVMKKTHHKKIVEALRVLGKANYEKLGNYLGMKNINQIARRLKEMMPPDEDNPKGLNLIFKPGTKTVTTSGREAYDYCLTNNQPKTDKEILASTKPTSEYSNNITDIQNTVVQSSLFQK